MARLRQHKCHLYAERAHISTFHMTHIWQLATHGCFEFKIFKLGLQVSKIQADSGNFLSFIPFPPPKKKICNNTFILLKKKITKKCINVRSKLRTKSAICGIGCTGCRCAYYNFFFFTHIIHFYQRTSGSPKLHISMYVTQKC